MGNNHSHYEHQLHQEREKSRKQHEKAEEHRRWLESERDRIAAEKDRELEEARNARAEKEKAMALQHQEEMKRAQEERDRIQQEKERAVAEQHANEVKLIEEQAKKQREHQEELQRGQKERERLQAENHEMEMRRIQAEKEAEMWRAEEELKRVEEAHRVQEELRALQEQMRLEEERKKMEELARRTEEEARKRVEKEIYLREEAERNLQEGIPPVKYPTGDEFQLMRQKLGYQEGYLHVAITGFTGCGKSSLINALRGLKSSNSPKKDIAKTGTSETTREVGRYNDPDPSRQWLAWYDVPGAGTVNVRDWQYFNEQGLYIFDVIIVVAGDRFTQTDIEILFHCKRFGIAAFVVRSKSDQHIGNIMKNDDCDSDSEDESDNDERKRNRLLEARDKYIADTRNNFQALLQQVGLPQQKVYIVCDRAVRSLRKNSKTDVIDEEELMRDLTQAAKDKSQSLF